MLLLWVDIGFYNNKKKLFVDNICFDVNIEQQPTHLSMGTKEKTVYVIYVIKYESNVLPFHVLFW